MVKQAKNIKTIKGKKATKLNELLAKYEKCKHAISVVSNLQKEVSNEIKKICNESGIFLTSEYQQTMANILDTITINLELLQKKDKKTFEKLYRKYRSTEIDLEKLEQEDLEQFTKLIKKYPKVSKKGAGLVMKNTIKIDKNVEIKP